MSGRLADWGRIDRSQTLRFTFDGKVLTGHAGDTVASALLANGVRLVGRSFKYHRPRGILSAGAEEPSALVTLISGDLREPNLPATMLDLTDGMVVESQNRWPSLGFDIQAVNGLFAPFLGAGFYYKTFMGPTRGAWKFYEQFIRKAAGLGRASERAAWQAAPMRNDFADLAIVGSGPAGLAAALAAGQSGARVVVIEQDALPGGRLLDCAAGSEADLWRKAVIGQLEALPAVRILARTTAFGLYDGNMLGLVARDEGIGALVQLHATRILHAGGAIEQPLVFPGNDRPGVMLAGAARAYLNRFGVLAGREVLVHCCNDHAWQTGLDLAAAGARVTIADQRPGPFVLSAVASAQGIAVLANARITETRGRRAIAAAYVESSAGKTWLDTDLLCVSGGWSPALHLTSHLGGRPVWNPGINAFVPGALPPDHAAAGAVTGQMTTRAAIIEGRAAGEAAVRTLGRVPVGMAETDMPEEPATLAPPVQVAGRGKAFVDLQMDVALTDVALAQREGFEAVELLKRYTTTGMGTDQGKTSNLAALVAMADRRAIAAEQAGTTVFRPPFTPVNLGTLAGRALGKQLKPIRRTPMHDWHFANGAEMIEVGPWMRPWFFYAAGPDAGAAYVAEMRMVRGAAGLMDISTLGKIEICGPDGATLLDRVYANGFAKLPVGRARYGVMLRDDGIVMDDGTTSRLADDRWFMTTSTAKAADVLSRLEFLLDTAWQDLRVSVSSVTDEWAGMSIAGPKARAILTAALPGIDLSETALPQMGVLQASWHGSPLRILRISYSGEWACELYVGARSGQALWQHLLDRGAHDGLRPYGVEALGALRVEKGHVAGPEIDGRTTIGDLGMGRMVAKRQGYAGWVLSQRPALTAPDRLQVVGLDCLDDDKRLRGGALIYVPGHPESGHGQGRVTSVTFSPELGRYIALALVAGGMARAGEEVMTIHHIRGERVRARVVSPHFLDPDGIRMRG